MPFKKALKKAGEIAGKALKRKSLKSRGAKIAAGAAVGVAGRAKLNQTERKGAKKGFKQGRSVGRIEGVVAASKSIRKKKPSRKRSPSSSRRGWKPKKDW